MNLTNTHIALIAILGLLVILLFLNNNQLNSLCGSSNDDSDNYERMSSCGAVQNRGASSSSNSSSIKNENLNSGETSNPTLILYYTAWCGHSRAFINAGWSDFLTLVKSTPAISDKLNVQMISCEDQQDKCAAEGVNGYPTVILYVAGKPIQFNGNRTSDALVAFVTQYI